MTYDEKRTVLENITSSQMRTLDQNTILQDTTTHSNSA
jgi:hypothetical protein